YETDFVHRSYGVAGNCFGLAVVDMTFSGVVSVYIKTPGKLLNVVAQSNFTVVVKFLVLM
ncbi:hypothetical protein RYX36_013163, partial [Vicia faba]